MQERERVRERESARERDREREPKSKFFGAYLKDNTTYAIQIFLTEGKRRYMAERRVFFCCKNWVFLQ
jgi:hypothetical protein